MQSADIIKLLSPEFKKVGSKYDNKKVASWIAKGFFERIGLDSRIKRIDEKFLNIISSNSNDIIDGILPGDLYKKISKTRNYYSHFKPEPEDILNIREMYNLIPIMKATITIILLSQMGIEIDKIKSILAKDKMFLNFTNHLRTEK